MSDTPVPNPTNAVVDSGTEAFDPNVFLNPEDTDDAMAQAIKAAFPHSTSETPEGTKPEDEEQENEDTEDQTDKPPATPPRR